MKSLLVISSYPKKNSTHGKSTVGVASYAKNTFQALQKNAPRKIKITVLAEKLPDDKDHIATGISVKRVWERDSFLTFPKLFKTIVSSYRSEKDIVIEFELSMFGSIFHLLPFPLFLLLLRLWGKKVTVVSHQVLSNINIISGHINISEHTITSILYTLGLKCFYTLLMLLSNKVIVFEDALKKRLSTFGSKKKISVIPHGVERFENKISKKAARKKLEIKENEFVVLCFGYLAWYKGTDLILDTVNNIRQNKRNKTLLILAGGPNPNHQDKEFYSRYTKNLTKKALESASRITGFVQQEDIPLYYSASDVVVLPYRTFMSASGPLSIAFSFKKPFLVSESLQDVIDQKDIKNALLKYRLSPKSVVFSNSNTSMAEVLSKFKKSTSLQKRLTAASAEIAKTRDWNTVGKRYYEELIH